MVWGRAVDQGLGVLKSPKATKSTFDYRQAIAHHEQPKSVGSP